ncbi:pyridoxal phosphate-dependent transferase [Thamnocephalis sphaerospora]|uniref:Pyridoxal phosphate-dependent transferase n=1 Tax=Thamnocephalis sphaerospora TaxID=78915 RepID=A0A4P9XTT8_9FUNG|nr:pyridoxal phosphate-dependent transferase [Thamnocephalis sphaerospora]|eukprot:RKP09593.1 pyridoxal phosphate-dependent transferase [Thamnocephalis sphaerospora]
MTLPSSTENANADGMPAPLPPAKDMTALLSRAARNRNPSPLKSLIKYMVYPDMISLGAGLPHSSTFPLVQLSAVVRDNLETTNQADATYTSLSVMPGPFDMTSAAPPPLDSVLQYGNGRGIPSVRAFFTEEIRRLHQPRYADWDVVATCGNTDGFLKAVMLFCDAGDAVAVEEWCYPAALETMRPLGIVPLPVAMDSEGMLPDALRDMVLQRSQDRPLRVVYLVPTGQNPTGSSMSVERRRAIYAVAQELNLILIEDDPYYHLQFPDGEPDQLLPSLLSMDTDGRVIRLETFAKVLAPGLRLGWLTAPAKLVQLVQYHNEVSTQQPSGVSQAIAAHLLLKDWGQAGWQRHLTGLRTDYRRKRDLMQAVCQRELTGLCEWTLPQAGMFFWFKLNVPKALRAEAGYMQRIFECCIDKRVLLVPGWQFAVFTPEEETTLSEAEKSDRAPCLRAAFSFESADKVEQAIVRLAQVLRSFKCGTE